MRRTKRILFVCTYRGGRSQIAHAYAKKWADGKIESDCACFDQRGISKGFVNIISEIGLEIDTLSPASVFNEATRKSAYDIVVSMCAGAETKMCKLLEKNIVKIFKNAPQIIQWDIDDFGACENAPDGFQECAKRTCGTIENNVRALIDSI